MLSTLSVDTLVPVVTMFFNTSLPSWFHRTPKVLLNSFEKNYKHSLTMIYSMICTKCTEHRAKLLKKLSNLSWTDNLLGSWIKSFFDFCVIAQFVKIFVQKFYKIFAFSGCYCKFLYCLPIVFSETSTIFRQCVGEVGCECRGPIQETNECHKEGECAPQSTTPEPVISLLEEDIT